MDIILSFLDQIQGYLFEAIILPLLHTMGLMSYADDVYDATGDSLVGIIIIILTYIILRPLEAWKPVETRGAIKDTGVDILYTFLLKGGFLSLIFFVLFDPFANYIEHKLHLIGYTPVNIEEILPQLHVYPLLSFLIYTIIIDFFEYIRHRLQHKIQWWWELHAVHHSQIKMTLWTDSRNHVLDSLIRYIWLAGIATIIGMPGEQFVFMILVFQLVESLSHANLHMNFGYLGNRMLVSPQYHRIHHGIGIGHEGKYHGCNFATLFPVWDIIFGTARFDNIYPQTGIQEKGPKIDYGDTFIQQQILAIKRILQPDKKAE